MQPVTAGSAGSMVSMVVVEVSDTGRGIAPDELAKIFEPFYTTRSNSVGLGLAISYDIVEQHGGKLSVRSVLGSGTTFQIYLPVADAG
jgi:signal transduction histidine kinase